MKYQNGYLGIDVEIIDYTKHPGKIVWDMLKQTWISLHNVEYDENNQMVIDFINDALSGRLNPTPFETIMIQAIFKNISRVNLAQITRQRNWLFNSESQMPQHVNHNIMIPLNIVKSEYYDRALKLIEESQKLYDDMTNGNDLGKEHTNIPYQDARYLLLGGQTTDISASFMLTKFVSDCAMRLENNTHDEINYTFRILIKNLIQKIENDKEMDKIDKHIYMTLLGRCDAFGANKKICSCNDMMFGNSFKRYPSADEEVERRTKECLFNYKRLAWYEELKRIYKDEPELLLPNEKEMIENWIKDE